MSYPKATSSGGGGSTKSIRKAKDRAARLAREAAARRRGLDPKTGLSKPGKAYGTGTDSPYRPPSDRAKSADARAARTTNQASMQKRKATRNLGKDVPAAPATSSAGGNPTGKKGNSGAPVRANRSNGPTPRSTAHRTGGGGKGPGPVKNGHKAGKGGGGKGGAKPTPAAGTGSAAGSAKDPLLAQARRSVGLELDPQLAALSAQVDAAKARLDAEKNSINQTQTNTSSNLKSIYDQLDTYLKANQASAATGFDAASGAVKGQFDQLVSALGGAGAQESGVVNNELSRLGINGAGVNADAIGRDQSLLQGLAGINQASAGAGIQSAKASNAGLMGMLQGNAQASGAEHQNSALRAALEQILGAEQDYTTQNNQLSSQYNQLEGSRGAKVQEMLDTIKQAQFEQQMELSQQAFNNQMTQDKFGLDVASLTSQNKSRKAQTKLEAAKLELERQKAAQAAADAAADRKLKEAGIGGSGSGAKFNPKGFSGAVELIHRSQPNPYQATKLETIIRKVRTGPGNIDPTNKGSLVDAIDYGKKQLKKMGIDSIANRRIVADSITAFYGQYGGS